MMMHYIYLIALGVLLLFIWAKYSQSLKAIDSSPGSMGKDRTAASTQPQPSEAQDTLDPDDISRRASATVAKLRQVGFAKEASILLDEINKKFSSILTEKNKKYGEVYEKYKKTLGEKKQVDSIMRSVAEGLVVLNDRGEVLMMNPAAEKLLEVNSSEQIGKPIKKMMNRSQLVSMASSNDPGQATELEMEASSDEAKKVLRASNAVIENENGQTIGIVSVFTDVTKQKELDELKSQFVSNISHELRTPLIAIRNSIEIMLSKRSGPLTEEQARFLVIADNNLKRLGSLIDDMLDLSKVEAKKADLKPEPTDIEKLVNDVCDSLDPMAGKKAIPIVRNIQHGIRVIDIDRKRITQVLNNLIGNAIKFTPEKGTITVSVNITRADDRDMLFVSVADTGIGISNEDIPKLFGKFQQLGRDRSSGHVSGTGLGLYISKELITLHGGMIWVKSERGKGSTFVFKVPV